MLEYILKQKDAGKSPGEIKSVLLATGWKPNDIDEAFGVIYGSALMPPPTVSVALQSVTEFAGPFSLLKDAWKIYIGHFWTYIGVLVVTGILGLVFVGGGLLALAPLKDTAPAASLAILFLIFIAAAIFGSWGAAALLYAIAYSEENIGIKESFRRGWRKIFSYLWLIIIVQLIIAGGLLLLVVPGIIFAISGSLAMLVLVAEDKKGVSAFLQSRAYIKGKWWGTFGRLLLIGIFVAVISLVFSGLVLFSVFVLKQPILAAVISIIGQIAQALLAPLVLVYAFLIYKNLKALKGGYAETGKKAGFVLVALLGIVGLVGLPLAASFVLRKFLIPEIFNISPSAVDFKIIPTTLPQTQIAPPTIPTTQTAPASKPAVIKVGPDMTVRGLTAGPSPVKVGQVSIFSFQVANIGTVDSAAAIGVLAPNARLTNKKSTCDIFNIKAGASCSVQYDLIANQPGVYTIEVFAAAIPQEKEANPDNGSAKLIIEVK